MKRKPSSKFFSNLEKAQLEKKLKRQKTDSEQDQSPLLSTHQTDLKPSQVKHDQIEEEKEGGPSTQLNSTLTDG